MHLRVWQAHHPVTGIAGIRLVVADRGVGIPPEIRRNLFAASFTTRDDPGAGLRLWIVKDLLDKRCGRIRCSSRVSGSRLQHPSGTIMMVFLPAAAGVLRAAA